MSGSSGLGRILEHAAAVPLKELGPLATGLMTTAVEEGKAGRFYIAGWLATLSAICTAASTRNSLPPAAMADDELTHAHELAIEARSDPQSSDAVRGLWSAVLEDLTDAADLQREINRLCER